MAKAAPMIKAPSKIQKFLPVLWWGLALGLVVGCAINTTLSGFDWVRFYYPRAHDFRPEVVANPLWVYFVLAPIAVLPVREAYAVFTLLNVVMIWLSSRLAGVNRFALLLSFPALWLLWFGQLDGFLALGAALGLWAVERRRPAWLGLALLLLLVKPHLGAPLALLYFLWSRDWRALAVCAAGFLLTLLVWRPDWPLIWIKSLLQFARPPAEVTLTTAGQQTNISLYPYGLVAWLVPLLLPLPRADRAIAVVAATFVSVPYAPTYSLLALLVLPVPWWAYVISSVPVVTGPAGYWFTVFAPLGCLAWLLVRYWPALLKRGLLYGSSNH